jgi:hypothetical protein
MGPPRKDSPMKQLLLATALILAPVGAFTAFQMAFVGSAQADASLGDLSPLKAIVADVQKIAATGDFAAAASRITDFETAWDDDENGMRPLNPTAWGNVDDAADKALKSLRKGTPTADVVTPALAALMAALDDPSKPAN